MTKSIPASRKNAALPRETWAANSRNVRSVSHSNTIAASSPAIAGLFRVPAHGTARTIAAVRRLDEDLVDWGGNGPLVHFAHANGFPPGTYRRLLEPLSGRARVITWLAPPLRERWRPEAVRSWRDLAGELVATLRRHGVRGAVGAGHSLGAVLTAMAAVRAPELFSSLVLFDPVWLDPLRGLFWRLALATGLADRIHPVRTARGRRAWWPDRETARRAWARKRAFRRWAPGVLEDYVACGLVADPAGGVRLAYPPEWEHRVFRLVPPDPWREVRELRLPTLVVRGERSDTLLPPAVAYLRRVAPAVRVVELPGVGHFVPMEAPRRCLELLVEQLGRRG
ncbi:MAG: alpha/beta hydrolase [Nitrospirae bacterium]|nr:MAG: alpha/beta hydrolase [Nitrospirota bacterium]